MKKLLCNIFNINNLGQKEFGLDLVRVWAMFSVLSVHFFLYNGFYKRELTDAAIIVPSAVRMLFYQAVPLFLLISGYFKRKAVFSRKYYVKLVPIVIMWLAVSALFVAYKTRVMGQSFSTYIWLKSVWSFTQPTYAWYINMYICLSVFIPILNAAYRSLDTAKKKRLLILSILLITSLPSTINRWRVNDAPIGVGFDYFPTIWPVFYYLIGCYISEYKPRINKLIGAAVVAVCCFGQGALDYLTADGGNYYAGVNFEYDDAPTVLTAVMLFLILYNIDVKCKPVRAVFACISSLSLPLYLVSWIGDSRLYKLHSAEMAELSDYPVLFFKIVPRNFAVSFLIALCLDIIVRLISNPIMKALMKKAPPEKPDELTQLRAEVERLKSEKELTGVK